MTRRSRTSRVWIGFGGLLVAMLLGAVFTLGSLNIPFEPANANEMLVVFTVSTFIVAALLVFGLILTRALLRTWLERRAGQVGSHFKTKMVMGAMAISLLPVIFMFIASYALMNRTLAKWFPRSLEIAAEKSQQLLNDLGMAEKERLTRLAQSVVAQRAPISSSASWERDVADVLRGADAGWTVSGEPSEGTGFVITPGNGAAAPEIKPASARMIRALPSGVEIWSAGSQFYLGARAPLADGTQFVAARRMPDNFLQRYTEIERQILSYQQQSQELRFFRTGMQISLALFTVLLLFSTTWFALFLSKQVTVPIDALAEGTREVSHGNFDFRVDVQAQDELGTLVGSFNQMTAQLGESRRQIDEFTRSLQVAVQELERQKRVIEAIVENIPTGIVSLDNAGNITRVNPAFMKMLGEHVRQARALPELLGEEAVRGVQSLMRKSLRMGTASKELEIALPGRVLHAAVTVTSLGPRRANPGYIVVVDDLTELLRAQKSAAWQEVAQRIAHEIKNPLTPIQLSSQRLLRHLSRTEDSAGNGEELRQLTAECAALIEREVSTLKSLVDEFSQFARFPTARPVPSSVNAIVGEALEVFHGRLDGVNVRTRLAGELPPVKADRELLRRVVINLIDNAAEAIEATTLREIEVATQLDPEGDAVEIIVADSGHGISPQDKDRLFLPHFSTRDRGTGLGLAIASRIVAEHNGTITVEDNLPVGARFVIRLPAVEVIVPEAVPPAT